MPPCPKKHKYERITSHNTLRLNVLRVNRVRVNHEWIMNRPRIANQSTSFASYASSIELSSSTQKCFLVPNVWKYNKGVGGDGRWYFLCHLPGGTWEMAKIHCISQAGYGIWKNSYCAKLFFSEFDAYVNYFHQPGMQVVYEQGVTHWLCKCVSNSLRRDEGNSHGEMMLNILLVAVFIRMYFLHPSFLVNRWVLTNNWICVL